MEHLQNDLFLRACRKEETERTPIWIMRQAGRYLPEYRAVREKADFLTMCKTPELAAEVTIQPIDLIGVDAAILFSDILVIPEAMGMELQMHEGRGPVFPDPVRTEAEIENLIDIVPEDHLQYVMDSITVTKKGLDGRVPLIGFSGSPWTLMTYMVEGSGSKTYSKVKAMIYNRPDLAHKLLDKLTTAVTKYLAAKIRSGVNAVQIFDTWGGILSHKGFNEFSLQYVEKIIDGLKEFDVPKIFFPKGVTNSYNELAAIGADVIGLDWTIEIGEVRKLIGDKVALQGNMDPSVLYADPEIICKKADEVLSSYGNGTGHIFNLGHGIMPDIKPAHAKALVTFIKENSAKYHQ